MNYTRELRDQGRLSKPAAGTIIGTMRARSLTIAILAIAALTSACARRVPTAAPTPTRILETRTGLASYYGKGFHGKITASGRPFDMNAMVAAHPSYPFGARLRVTNLANGRSVDVRVQDRGPAPPERKQGVILDLSRGAAQRLGFVRQGRTRVRLEVLEW
jgi:peptidoglycan lytic transglycosylase